MVGDEDTDLGTDDLEVEKDEKAAPDDSSASEKKTGAEATETDSEDTEDGDEAVKAKEEKSRKDNALAVYRRRAEKAERNERRAQQEYRRLAEELLSQRKAGPEPRSEAPKGPPKREDFGDDLEAYFEAKSDYIADRKIEAFRAEMAREQQEARRTAETRQAEAATAERARAVNKLGESEYHDYDEVVYHNDAPCTPAMLNAMLDAEVDGKLVGQKIAYYLGSHPEEAERIAALPTMRQVKEIDRLTARLTAKMDLPKKETNATEPIKPAAGKSGGKSKIDPDKLPIKEWMRLRNEGKIA